MPCDTPLRGELADRGDAVEQATCETLRDEGVDVANEPCPRPYGIDLGIREPSGDAMRIRQTFVAGGS